MAYNPILDAEIATGEPVTSTTHNKIQDNFDDHESRIQDLESGSAVSYPPIILAFNGRPDLFPLGGGAPGTEVRTTINFGLTINNARLIIGYAGVSGSTQVDVQYKRGAGAWTSIYTTKPSVAFSSGSYAVSSNQVLNLAQVDLQAGDLIRMFPEAAQATSHNFIVRIDYTKN